MSSRQLLSVGLIGFVLIVSYGCHTGRTDQGRPSFEGQISATTRLPEVTRPPAVTLPPRVTQPPADYVPTAADAAKAAAEQIKHLPSTAVLVDCAPGVPRYPIYTRPSGGISRQRRYILADGRCFLDSVVRDLPIEAILPEASPR